MRQLFGKSRRAIAKTLLEEGFEIESQDPRPQTLAKRKEWDERRIRSMIRNVDNDFEWWDKRWRKLPQPTNEDRTAMREGYIAAMESDLEELHELIDDGKTKSTAKSQLIQERRLTRRQIAMARGVDQVVPDPDAERPKVPVIGLVLGTKNIDPETAEELRRQGIEI